MRPLVGLRVLDCSRTYPGALATMVLADSGAEVIKVEPPGGCPTRRHCASVMWHRGKKSIVVDMATAMGRSQALSLAASVDVLLETFRPGVAESLGLGYTSVVERNPGLVYCSLTGFGARGPLARLKAYEGIVHAKLGRFDNFWRMVEKDGPVYSSLMVASFGSAMLAIQAIMAALIVRNRTGAGQRVETSMLQALPQYDLMTLLTWQLAEKGRGPHPGRGNPGGPIPAYMTARTKDGHWLQFGNFTVDTQRNFLRATGLEQASKVPRFARMPRYDKPEDEAAFQRMVLEKVLQKTRDEWMAIFLASDVAAEPCGTTQEGLHHAQAIHNGNVIEVNDPLVGRSVQLGPLARYSDTPTGPQGPSPRVSEHTPGMLASPASRNSSRRSDLPVHPLTGITVLEFASYIAAPLVNSFLADLGARVIKIEPLTGDLYRAVTFPAMCKTLQGKESVALDLKDPRAQEVVRRLVRNADVLLHNYRPGVPERLGIDYASVRYINPAILYVYAGAYGSTGPHSHRVGFHPIAGAIAGGSRFQLGRSLPPSPRQAMTLDEVQAISNVLRRANDVNPDQSAALACAAALMVALYHCAVTGKGQYMETSMLGGNLYANADDALWYEGKPDRALVDEGFNGLHALYRMYRAKEGWVFLACPKQEDWRILVSAAGCESLASDERFATAEARRANNAALAAALSPVFRTRTAPEWETLLTAQDVACVEIYDGDNPKFLNTTPWVKELGYLVPSEHPSFGKYWRHGPPFAFSATPPVAGTNCYLGEHTRSVLRETGHTDGDIDALVRDGVALEHSDQNRHHSP
ncbi:MAG: CoA transferase [Chloroflexi bacterium]|nr:CoA transferase [Chloroflexota bacterium]